APAIHCGACFLSFPAFRRMNINRNLAPLPAKPIGLTLEKFSVCPALRMSKEALKRQRLHASRKGQQHARRKTELYGSTRRLDSQRHRRSTLWRLAGLQPSIE